MNFRAINLIALLLVVSAAGCRPPSQAPEIERHYVADVLDGLVKFKYRPSGSNNNRLQVEYILKQLAVMGSEYQLQEFSAMTSEGNIVFRNIIVEIRGRRDEFIIIGAHHDTKRLLSTPDFIGANDGASGTAALLAMLKAIKMSGVRPYFSLRFIFFDGEECFNNYSESDGLFGSRYYARGIEASGEIKDCRAAIILDMIGDKELCLTLPADTDQKLSELFFAVAEEAGKADFCKKYNGYIIDDHSPFQRLGVPVIDLIDFEFGPQNSYWHTGEDNMHRIDAGSIEIVANMALRLVWRIK